MAIVEYITKESPVHNLHPLTKMFWASVILTFSLLLNDYRYLTIVFLSVLAVAALGKILKNIKTVVSGLFIVALILMILQIIFYQSGSQLISWGLLEVTTGGILFGTAVAIRMLIIVTSFVIFFCTTQTRDIIMTLVDKLHVPYEFAFMFTTAVRFIPTFMGEVSLISQAQKARAYQLEGWNPVKKIKGFMPVALPLVLISLNKAEKLSLAMETRGFGTGPRSYYRQIGFKNADGIVIGVMITILILGIYLRMNGFGSI